MIVWTGMGFLVALVGIIALVGTEYISEMIAGNDSFYQENMWVIFIGMLVAAAITFALNKTILMPKSQTVIDKNTQQEIELKKDHSLFFVSTKWWPVIFVVIGAIAAIRNLMGS